MTKVFILVLWHQLPICCLQRLHNSFYFIIYFGYLKLLLVPVLNVQSRQSFRKSRTFLKWQRPDFKALKSNLICIIFCRTTEGNIINWFFYKMAIFVSKIQHRPFKWFLLHVSNSPSSRLLIGLLLTRLIQYRFRLSRTEVWLFASPASSFATSSLWGSGDSASSTLRLAAFEQGSDGVTVSLTFSLSVSSGGLSAGSVEASSGGGGSANRGGFSVISLRVRVLKQSCSKSPPSRWQSSLMMPSQSPSNSTSKFRWGSGSLLIRTWGTSWGMESGQRREKKKLKLRHPKPSTDNRNKIPVRRTRDEGNRPDF